MGLFWSLSPAPSQRWGARFLKQDLTTPTEFTFTVYDGHLEDASLRTATPLAVTKVQKWFMKEEEVDRIKVHSGRLRGTLFRPKGVQVYWRVNESLHCICSNARSSSVTI